ncbi:hypothetical protein RHS01_04096 [Rhizoctonia solani]|uniref:T6SS Phospholipase effector Tle1-like catalytic domain-containing protein n=1 Tax=Rhizoctonia solani TaxID=456999 RepID=A0A8H7IF14_9AGAM|nr:hypothetical protein RHS01_04096 [Rhizoctonia solani]
MSSDAPARPEPTAAQSGPSETTISLPQVIPPVDGLALPGRSLVLCFDGTGDQYDHDNSNIVRFVQLLKKDDKKRQMVYYQTGIGTGVGPQPSGVFTSKLSQTLDTMIASGLGDHVRGGYEFLMQNYNEGDRISIFGFSRGAYTARALAGMLHKVGLLPAYNHEQVAFAYKMFKRDDEEGWKMSNGFKRAFCIDVKIDFVGVFDTVNSVGIIPRELPFAKSNYLIRVFRHAVALDEHRAKFQPNLWGRSTESEEKLGEAGKKKVYHRQKSKSGVWNTQQPRSDPSTLDDPRMLPQQHRYPIPLCRTGRNRLEPADALAAVKIPTPIADGHKPQASDATMVDSPEETMSALVPPEFIKLGSEADAKDALEPIYDQLSIAKWWWILELLPMKKRYQRHDKSWSTWLSINFGGPRVIHGQKRFGVLVHRTVQYRMQQLGYKPRAELLAEPVQPG